MPLWLKVCFKIKHGLIALEEIIAASSLLLLIILALFQIISRNFFNTGFSHMEVLTRHLILFIIFMGAALISEQNKHIKIDVLVSFLTIEQQQKLIRPLLLLSAIICACFCWYSIIFWLDEWHYAPANELWSVYLALVLPVGFFILSLHLLLLTLTGFEQELVLTEKKTKQATSCSELS